MSNEAWVTLATNDSYALGALVLANSLRRSGTTRKIVIMVTSTGLSNAMRSQLTATFDEVVDVSMLDSGDAVNLALLERPELGVTFTKLHCWCLVQYEKCVFLDADTLVLRNCDELFEREELSAAPDAGWPDCFNSGVFVFVPSKETYRKLLEYSAGHGSFDGGDQGLLNMYFNSWPHQDIAKHLPFLYNMCATATYTYLPAFKHYGHSVKIIHFIGTSKPWHVKFDASGQPKPQVYEEHTSQFLKQWWQIFRSDVQPKMHGDMDFERNVCPEVSGNAAPVHAVSSGDNIVNPEGNQSVSKDDRKRWEDGQPDFRGVDAFDNILKKIDSTMSTPKSDMSGSSSPRNVLDFEKNWPSSDLSSAELSQKLSILRAEREVNDGCGEDIVDGDQVMAEAKFQQKWEQGHPDFLGVHSFENILAKLNDTLDENIVMYSPPNEQWSSDENVHDNNTYDIGDNDMKHTNTYNNHTVQNQSFDIGIDRSFDVRIGHRSLPEKTATPQLHKDIVDDENIKTFDEANVVEVESNKKPISPTSFDFVLQKLTESIGPEVEEKREHKPVVPRKLVHCPTCGQDLPENWKPPPFLHQRRRVSRII